MYHLFRLFYRLHYQFYFSECTSTYLNSFSVSFFPPSCRCESDWPGTRMCNSWQSRLIVNKYISQKKYFLDRLLPKFTPKNGNNWYLNRPYDKIYFKSFTWGWLRKTLRGSKRLTPAETSSKWAGIKARSHVAIFLCCDCDAENGLCWCQWGCSHSAISCACDALVYAMSHMIRFHTHSVRLRYAIPM